MMKHLWLIKKPILFIIVVCLSLKVWTTVSEIANSHKDINHTIVSEALTYRNLAEDTQSKQVALSLEAKESFDEDLITDEIITPIIEIDKTTLEVKDKMGRLKTQNISSVKASDDKDQWNISSRKGSSPRTCKRAHSLHIISTRKSKPLHEQQNDLSNTIEAKSVNDDQFHKPSFSSVKIIEKRHVMFLKVHKCGSSSVQNIFLRFGHRRNLTFILGHDNKNKSESGYTNDISYFHTLSDNLVVPPPPGRHFEILCCHVIYNEEQFKKYLPEDTVYIGIVREPVKRLESAFNYFRMYDKVDTSEFAKDPLNYDVGIRLMANNRMAFEYGFPNQYFPPFNSSTEHVKKLVSSYLKSFEKRFDFIIINERMDESLVYMKRLLRWQIKDILYTRLLTTTGSRRKFEDQDALKLRDFLHLDYALYEFAVRRFKEQLANVNDDFQEEVKHFQEINGIVGQFCDGRSNETFTVAHSQWNKEFTITQVDCRYFSLFEMTFIQEIRQRQYGTINN